jgi:5-formyltetrahydrofolate cyclo-ligase
MSNAIQKEKALLRKQLCTLRDQVSPELRRQMSRQILAQLHTLPFWNEASSVLLYASIRGEVETHELITESLQQHPCVVLPRVDKNEGRLVLYRIFSWQDLIPGGFGIYEPRTTGLSEISPNTIDCAIIPGICFDTSGARIGYGKGYYDKLLAGLTIPTVGFCFEHQLVSRVPCEPHDQHVRMIITEKRVIYCDGYHKD